MNMAQLEVNINSLSASVILCDKIWSSAEQRLREIENFGQS